MLPQLYIGLAPLYIILPQLFRSPARHENSHQGTKAQRFTKGPIIKGENLAVLNLPGYRPPGSPAFPLDKS